MVASGDELERLLLGDKAAWAPFVRRYAAIIYSAINRRLAPFGRLQDSEDVAQDVFLKLCNGNFRLLRNFDPRKAKLTTWLTIIATSTAIDHLRRNSKVTQPLDDLPEEVAKVEAVEKGWIKYPPDLLSPRQALVLRLLYDKDLDVAEAAEILAVDPQTVRSMHHKALVKLRAYFQAQSGDAAALPPVKS